MIIYASANAALCFATVYTSNNTAHWGTYMAMPSGTKPADIVCIKYKGNKTYEISHKQTWAVAFTIVPL